VGAPSPDVVDLFAVQPYVDAATYASEASFRSLCARLVGACAAQRRRDARGRWDAPAVLVFPEHIGTFLALGLLGRLGGRLSTLDAAIALACARLPGRTAAAAARLLRGPRRVAALPTLAALHAVAPRVERAYERTFRDLAVAAEATIVAGSVLLPRPRDPADPRDDDTLRDAVYNVSFTYGPDGALLSETRKVNLVPILETSLGLTPGAPEALRVAGTPAGPLGTLVCYDGFCVPHTRAEPGFRAVGPRLEGARILAQPAANPWPWEERWVHAPPGDPIRRSEQWRAEGLERQLRDLHGVRYVVTAHLSGQVLDQRFEGPSVILERAPGDGSVRVLASATSASYRDRRSEIVHARVPWP
jgi:predicted amidohydrolase